MNKLQLQAKVKMKKQSQDVETLRAWVVNKLRKRLKQINHDLLATWTAEEANSLEKEMTWVVRDLKKANGGGEEELKKIAQCGGVNIGNTKEWLLRIAGEHKIKVKQWEEKEVIEEEVILKDYNEEKKEITREFREWLEGKVKETRMKIEKIMGETGIDVFSYRALRNEGRKLDKVNSAMERIRQTKRLFALAEHLGYDVSSWVERWEENEGRVRCQDHKTR
jgi:hypothetical protein